MTLIVGMRAGDGFVIAADSEENAGCYRRSVQKIEPRQIGDVKVIIAGSGSADLIESFVVRVERIPAKRLDPASFRETIEDELVSFYTEDVATYQFDEGEEKEQKLIIAAQWSNPDNPPIQKTRDDSQIGACGAWITRHCKLIPINSFELAGYDALLYHHAAERIYRKGLSIQQGILAALYVLVIGENTCPYIGLPLKAVVVRPNGVWMEDDGYISVLQQRLLAYEEKLNSLFLDCADTSVHPSKLAESIKGFSSVVDQLHRDQIEKAANEMDVTEKLNLLFSLPSAYPKIPEESSVLIHFADMRVEIDHDKPRPKSDEITPSDSRKSED